MKLKLCRAKREINGGRKLYNTAKRRDQQVKEQNRFEALADTEDDTIEQGCLQLKKSYNL